MPKQLLYGEDARQKFVKGAEKLNKFVSTTLGPKGRNIVLDKKWTNPVVLHDGVKIAKDIDLEDPFENMGAQLIKEAASKSADQTGDGTTTATLLAYNILKEGAKAIDFGANPMSLKKGIDKAVAKAVGEIRKMAIPVNGSEKLEQVATVSAANSELGKIIATAIDKVGKFGLVTEEEGGLETKVEYKMGMEFDKGYVSPHFVTNPDKMEAEIEDLLVVVTDEKLTSSNQIVPLLENSVKALDNKNLLIISDGFEGDAFATLVINKMRGVINAIPVPAPLIGDRRRAILEDIAVLTGATFITKDAGLSVDKMRPEFVGRADRVWADGEKTRIIGGRGDSEKIAERKRSIQTQIEETKGEFDKEKLKERLAKLEGGVAVIRVGAPTEQEMKEKCERVNDAIGATKSAIQEGIIAGGGVTLFQVQKVLNPLINSLYGDQKMGAEIVQRTLSKPIRKILENAGEEAGVILNKIENEKEIPNYGYDVENEEYGDLILKGIIDPAKVTISALQNAASVAASMLTTEGLVTDLPEKKNEEQNPL